MATPSRNSFGLASRHSPRGVESESTSPTQPAPSDSNDSGLAKRIGVLASESRSVDFERRLSQEIAKRKLQGVDDQSIQAFEQSARDENLRRNFWPGMESQAMTNEQRRQKYINENADRMYELSMGNDMLGMRSNQQRRIMNARAFSSPTDAEALAIKGSWSDRYRKTPITAYGEDGEEYTFHVSQDEQDQAYADLKRSGYKVNKPYNPESKAPDLSDPVFQSGINGAIQAIKAGADPEQVKQRLTDGISQQWDSRMSGVALDELQYRLDAEDAIISAKGGDAKNIFLDMAAKYPNHADELRKILLNRAVTEDDVFDFILEGENAESN